MKGEGYMIKSPVIKYLTVLFSITCLTGCSGAYTGSFPAETVPGTGLYPWEAIGAWNRVRQLQPFPEVVKCTENPDGTWSLDVEAILIENGDDCAFRHTVTMKEKDGRWIYLGNHIPEEEKSRAPGYRPRREFAGQSGQ